MGKNSIVKIYILVLFGSYLVMLFSAMNIIPLMIALGLNYSLFAFGFFVDYLYNRKPYLLILFSLMIFSLLIVLFP